MTRVRRSKSATATRQDYLQRVRRAASDLVRDRFVLPADVEGVVAQAEQTWNVIVGR